MGKKKYRILVLDDDESWLEKHALRLTQAGFEPESTQDGEAAIKFIRDDTSLRAAIIDEILEVPNKSGSYQLVQGKKVVKYIKSKRLDKFLCVMVTNAPYEFSKDKKDIIKISQEFENETGVKVFHKFMIEKKEDYSQLIEYLNNNIEPKPEPIADVLFVIGTNQDKVYYVKSKPKEFAKRLSAIILQIKDRLIQDANIEHGLYKVEALLKEQERLKKIIKLEKPKPNTQGFNLLNYVSEQRMLTADKYIFLPKVELQQILKGETQPHQIKTRIHRLAEELREQADIPNKLYEFGTEPITQEYGAMCKGEKLKGWVMKFRVINVCRMLQEYKNLKLEADNSFRDDY